MAKTYTLSIFDTIEKAKRCSNNAVDENRLRGLILHHWRMVTFCYAFLRGVYKKHKLLETIEPDVNVTARQSLMVAAFKKQIL